MPVLRELDFDKLAEQVVASFLAGKTKLADGVAEQATQHGLNPDQIERLVQSANTMTFLKMMDQRKQQGAEDLTHEFDPVDSKQVIRIVIDNAGIHISPNANEASQSEELGPEDSDELPNEMSGDNREEKPNKKDKEPTKDEPKPPKKEAAVWRARKLVEILEDQSKQAEWIFEDTFKDLAMRFRQVYNPTSYEAFEKDALAEYGDATGLAVLNLLRQTRKMPALEKTATFEKVAAMQDHHVSMETPELQLFETLYKIATKSKQLEQGIAYMRTQCV